MNENYGYYAYPETHGLIYIRYFSYPELFTIISNGRLAYAMNYA
jgi:hypothetical protein